MASTGENPSISAEKQPYLVASQIETDYPLLVMGGSQLLSKPALFIAKTATLGTFGAETDYPYLIRQKYPEMADLLIDLNKCENGGSAVWRCGDEGLSCGPFQFKKATFYRYCSGSRDNPENQLDCAAEMIKAGMGSHWLNCWRMMNLNKYL